MFKRSNIPVRTATISMLIVAVCVIWGHNLYRIVRELSVTVDIDDAALPVINPSVDIDSSWFCWRFPDSLRDPFQLTHEKKRLPIQLSHLLQPAHLDARYRLLGIINDARGRMAVVETPRLEILFLHKRQKFDSLTVRDIDNSSMCIGYKKLNFYLKLTDSVD